MGARSGCASPGSAPDKYVHKTKNTLLNPGSAPVYVPLSLSVFVPLLLMRLFLQNTFQKKMHSMKMQEYQQIFFFIFLPILM
jgi:hypothetical protein